MSSQRTNNFFEKKFLRKLNFLSSLLPLAVVITMGESQLKRLKARLKANGLIGQTNSKSKKQSKRVPALARTDKDEIIRNIREEFNPFEIKTTRQKHADILGRKVQGATGRPGLSKQTDEEVVSWQNINLITYYINADFVEETKNSANGEVKKE